MKCSCLLLSTFVSVVLGDLWPGRTNVTTNNTCSSALSSLANATDVQNGTILSSGNGLGLWRVAVSTPFQEATIEDSPPLTETSPGAVANVWLDTFTDVDVTNGSNDYAACAYIFKKMPYNTMLRGQDDDGSCEQMLSKQCIAAITSRAAETAKWLVQNPTQGPYSNLTPPILNAVCQDVLYGIGYGTSYSSKNTFPPECIPYFQGPNVESYPLADVLTVTSNKSNATTNCTFYDSDRDGITVNGFSLPSGLRYPFNATNGSAAASYDELVDQVWPILTVVFPPANVSRTQWIGWSQGTMTCLRAGKNIKANSRIPAALPAATPVHFPFHLSKGAIAGIVIGSVVGAAILAGAIWWICRRHRKQSTSDDGKDFAAKELSPVMSEEENGVSQLDSKGPPAQLEGLQRAELRGEDGRHELIAGTLPPQELDSSTLASSSISEEKRKPASYSQ